MPGLRPKRRSKSKFTLLDYYLPTAGTRTLGLLLSGGKPRLQDDATFSSTRKLMCSACVLSKKLKKKRTTSSIFKKCALI